MNNAVRPRHAVRRHALAVAVLSTALGLAACGPGSGAAGPTAPGTAPSRTGSSAPTSSAAPSGSPSTASAATSASTSRGGSGTPSTSPRRPSHKPSSTKATRKPTAKKPAAKRPSSLQASAASRRRLVASCLATSKGLNQAVKAWNDAVSSGSALRLDHAARLLRSTAETVGKRGHDTRDASFERLSKQVANDLDVMAIRHDHGEDVYGDTLTEHSKQLRAYCAKKL